MRKTIILAALAAALTSTIGMAQQPAPAGSQSFVHDGYTYVYTASPAGAATVLQGRRLPGGETFRLRVQGNRVTGRSGGAPVSFRVSEARGAADGIVAQAL